MSDSPAPTELDLFERLDAALGTPKPSATVQRRTRLQVLESIVERFETNALKASDVPDSHRSPTALDGTDRGFAAGDQWTALDPKARIRTWRCTTPALLAAKWRGVDFGHVLPGAWLSSTGIAGLYGVFQLVGSYSSNLFRVVTSAAGNATLDAAQIRRELPNGRLINAYDPVAIDNFLGANSGSIDQIYDQTGQSRTLVQATLAARPKWSKNRVGFFNPITFAANAQNATNHKWMQCATGTLARGNMTIIAAIRNRASRAQSCILVANPAAAAASQARFMLGLGNVLAPSMALSSGASTNDLANILALSDEQICGMVTTTSPSNLLTMWSNNRRSTVARAIGAATMTGWNVGTDGTVGSAISHFDLLAMVVYNRALSEEEQLDATAILAEICGFNLQQAQNGIYLFGDSMAMGTGTRALRNHPYFAKQLISHRAEWFNYGTGGNQLSADLASRVQLVDAAFTNPRQRMVFVVQSCGADILAGRTGQQVFDDLVSLTNYIRSRGSSDRVKVVVTTTSPAKNPPLSPAMFTQGAAFRNLVLTNSYLFDGVVNLIDDPVVGLGNETNPLLYNDDGVHPTELAYYYYGQLYARALDPLLVG